MIFGKNPIFFSYTHFPSSFLIPLFYFQTLNYDLAKIIKKLKQILQNHG